MADKEAPSSPTHPATPVIVPLIVVFFLGTLITILEAYLFKSAAVVEFINWFILFITGKATLGEIARLTTLSGLRTFIYIFLSFSFASVIVLVWLIGTTARKLIRVHKKMFDPLHPPHGHGSHGAAESVADVATVSGLEAVSGGTPPAVEDVNPKWQKVLEHLASENAADWKLAILEADIMLEEMLEKMGYPGQTISEKLKMVEKSDFDTLDMAWEAHKVRNSIAHEGSDFILSKDEADRVITMFERVFREFRYI